MATEDDLTSEERPQEECESSFAWEGRVMLVSTFWVLPGAVFGAILRLCIPDSGPVSWWITGWAILAAIFGGLLEADHIVS